MPCKREIRPKAEWSASAKSLSLEYRRNSKSPMRLEMREQRDSTGDEA